jgi:hypothetical protein
MTVSIRSARPTYRYCLIRECLKNAFMVTDNLDIGRPESVELIFTGRGPGAKGRPIKNDTVCKTKVVSVDTEVTMNAFFKPPAECLVRPVRSWPVHHAAVDAPNGLRMGASALEQWNACPHPHG